MSRLVCCQCGSKRPDTMLYCPWCALAAHVEPIHPQSPDGHEHYPGQHCVGCADLFIRDRERLGQPAKAIRSFTMDDEKLFRGLGIKVDW